MHPRTPKARIAAPLLVTTLLLAACGGGGDEDPQSQGPNPPEASASGTPAPSGGASGAPSAGPSAPAKLAPTSKDAKLPTITRGEKFGQDPTIKFEGLPPPDIMFKVLSEGDGPEVEIGNVVVADFRGQVWETEGMPIPPFENTFETDPIVKLIGRGAIIPAWDLKLPGVKVGSRVLLVSPPSTAFGPKGNEKAGILGIDTLAFVIDVIDTFSPAKLPDGSAVTAPKGLPKVEGEANPSITVPKSAAPTELVAETLIKGKGPAVKTDQTLAVNYKGVLWKDGRQFDASWGKQFGPEPLGFHLGSPSIIKGWNEGLRGKPVGSRVLLVIPPALGYGTNGNKAAGITGTDTLVFVVDILGAY